MLLHSLRLLKSAFSTIIFGFRRSEQFDVVSSFVDLFLIVSWISFISNKREYVPTSISAKAH